MRFRKFTGAQSLKSDILVEGGEGGGGGGGGGARSGGAMRGRSYEREEL